MVVASEIETHGDPSPGALRGVAETASALILDEDPAGTSGFGRFLFKGFTEYLDAVRAYGSYETGPPRLHVAQDPRFEDYALKYVPDAAHELLDAEGLDLSRIGVVLPPQMSPGFVARLGDSLGIGRDRCIDVPARRADLFTSSLAYAFGAAREERRVEAGDVGLIIGVG